MNTLSTVPSLRHFLQFALSGWENSTFQQPQDAGTEEDTRDRMDFITDMMQENSNAFASDSDVQSMMYLYPDRF